MSVLLETTLGDIVIDLYVKRAPKSAQNFLKLCKSKYYNFSLFDTVERDLSAKTGSPWNKPGIGESVWGKLFVPEMPSKYLHNKKGTVSWVTNVNEKGIPTATCQFFITLSEAHLDFLDGQHAIFGRVAEGFDVLEKLNDVLTDDDNKPFRDIRIKHTIILDDPFEDPVGLFVPEKSPEPTDELLRSMRLAEEEENADAGDPEEEERRKRQEDADARALTLEMVGDLPFAEIKPPENVLFVCKLNPITTDEDLEIIFSRFGAIKSCEIVRDKKTGESLQYAFIEFENKDECEAAYFKMDKVLIDDRRIHVDFSQSVSKLHMGFLRGDREEINQEGFGGSNTLRQRKQYREQHDRRDDEYNLVFDIPKDGSIRHKRHRSRDRHDKHRRERSRSRDRRRREEDYYSRDRRRDDRDKRRR